MKPFQGRDSRRTSGRTRPLRPWHAAGFSLLEIIIVLSIIGLLLGLAIPRYHDYTKDQRLRSAARILASDLRVAQQEAITRRTSVTVTFRAADRLCGGNLPAASYAITSGPLVIKRECLLSGIEWAALPAPRIAFDATGAAFPGGALHLRNSHSARSYVITVVAETGTIAHDAR